MSVAYQASSSAVSGTATSTTITWPGSPSGQLLIAAFAFEVGSGTGPWVSSAASGGWSRCFYQAPSAAGCGLEVWNTQGWSSGASTMFNFGASYPYVATGIVYTGQYTGAGNVVRASLSDAVTGNDPDAPSLYVYEGEMVVAFAAEKLSSPGWVSPAGYSERLDNSRGGGFGNAELTAADKLAAIEGLTGSLGFTATSAGGTDKGATATIAIRAAAQIVAATSPMIAIEFGVAL